MSTRRTPIVIELGRYMSTCGPEFRENSERTDRMPAGMKRLIDDRPE